MTCDLCVPLLGEYVDGTMSAADRLALAAHFASNPECAEYLREYEAIPKAARAATDVAMPPLARARLFRRLRQATGRG